MATWRGGIDKPVVSICCISYNHEPYIEDALAGFLLQQTDFPFEILIHDDASTDRTAEIIRAYEARYPQLIKAICQSENQFSKGRRMNPEFNYPRAQGKYIALCEGDDYWTDRHKLQKQARFLDEHKEFALTAHAVDIIDDTVHAGSYSPYYSNPKAVSTFEDVLFEHFIPTLSILFRKECMPLPLPYFSREVFSMDKAQALLLTANGLCHYDRQVMGCYRHHDGGITKDKLRDIELFRRREYALYREIFGYLDTQPKKWLRQRLARVDFTVALMYRVEKNYALMFAFFMKSFSKDPLIAVKIMFRKYRIRAARSI